MRTPQLLWSLVVLLSCASADHAFQPPGGGVPAGGTGRESGGKRTKGGGDPPPCMKSKVVISCGMPACEVSLGSQRWETDQSGEVQLSLGPGKHKIVVSKAPDYDPVSKETKRLGCADSESLPITLTRRGVSVRIRTNIPDCDIYDQNSGSLIGHSDAQGLAQLFVTSPALLVEARKPGYLADAQRIEVKPNGANGETVLTLQPLKASLTISSHVQGARAQIDNQTQSYDVSQVITVTPGKHQITVNALGYSPGSLTLTVSPDKTYTQPITLQRLSNSDLAQQAEKSFKERAYADVLLLCRYMFEFDPAYPAAHRLAGLTYLAQGNYGMAEDQFARALSASETIRFQVRRHPREDFDLSKGHNVCAGVLILNKGDVEFQGLQYSIDNFKAAYSQIHSASIQLRKNIAVYLSTKIIDARGKNRQYDFYSFDGELSQAGKAYLEMIQHLLRSH
jgi:tetratricopeptide (TPR) repeat protein